MTPREKKSFRKWTKPDDVLNAITNPGARELARGITSAIGLTDAGERPAWANRAAMEFSRSCFGTQEIHEGYGLGFLLGVAKQFLTGAESLGGVPATAIIGQILEEAQKDTSAEAADFWLGYADGRDPGQLLSPAQTARIYLVAAVLWRECSTLKTAREWREFLIAKGAMNRSEPDEYNEKLDSEIQSVGNLLRRIGVPLTNRGGRPKKKTPTRPALRRCS